MHIWKLLKTNLKPNQKEESILTSNYLLFSISNSTVLQYTHSPEFIGQKIINKIVIYLPFNFLMGPEQ